MTREIDAAKYSYGTAAPDEHEETEAHVLLNGSLVKASDVLSIREASKIFGLPEQSITAHWYLFNGSLFNGGFVGRTLTEITVRDALEMFSGSCVAIENSQEGTEIEEVGEAAWGTLDVLADAWADMDDTDNYTYGWIVPAYAGSLNGPIYPPFYVLESAAGVAGGKAN